MAGEASVLVANIEGLLTRNKDYKVGMITELCRENKAAIVSLCETHLTRNILDAEINIDGYVIYREDRRAPIRKGGVMM